MSIEAMKQALDYMQSDLAGRIKKKPHAISALRQAIEQTEKQEPAGVVYSVPVGQVVGPDDTLKFAHTVLSDDRLLLNQSLYHEPQPQREWVGLTDEDLANCSGHEVRWALFWEKLLKEKNT